MAVLPLAVKLVGIVKVVPTISVEESVIVRVEVSCIMNEGAASTNVYEPPVMLTRLIPPSTPNMLMCAMAVIAPSVVPLTMVTISGLVYDDAFGGQVMVSVPPNTSPPLVSRHCDHVASGWGTRGGPPFHHHSGEHHEHK